MSILNLSKFFFMEEIVNKVSKSGLTQLDLADFKPNKKIVPFDLKDNLWQGLALKEKAFRSFAKTHDWTQYEDKVVAIFCSADAIIPSWAYMLVVSELHKKGVNGVVGDIPTVEKELIRQKIADFNTKDLENGKFIIKGCSDVSDPAFVMTELTKKLLPIASSIMYGEPCSTVPVYKKPKT